MHDTSAWAILCLRAKGLVRPGLRIAAANAGAQAGRDAGEKENVYGV